MAGLWFSRGTPVSSANRTDRHDITEILLKVASNTLTQPKNFSMTDFKYYVIKFVSDLWQVSGFLRVLRFPPPIKLTINKVLLKHFIFSCSTCFYINKMLNISLQKSLHKHIVSLTVINGRKEILKKKCIMKIMISWLKWRKNIWWIHEWQNMKWFTFVLSVSKNG